MPSTSYKVEVANFIKGQLSRVTNRWKIKEHPCKYELVMLTALMLIVDLNNQRNPPHFLLNKNQKNKISL